MGQGTFDLQRRTLALAAVAALGLTASCNTHPVELSIASSAVEVIIPYERGTSQELDILWMIDNSGSMCQEQKLLRDNFDRFISTLAEIDVDFHIGVTTTHMIETSPLERIAKPGHLQSTPQPIPGFDATCYHALDENGQMDKSDFEPVLENIRLAVECTQVPGDYQHLLNPSPQALRCAFYPSEEGACDGLDPRPTRESLFPPFEAYRPIPKVLKAENYRNSDNTLRIDELRADFACMSMVGTRGYGFEKGLSAIVKALDPELTGGPDADPESTEHPNAGFLRKNARLGIILVSDENDCSHDGTLDEQTSCGVAECSFRDRMGAADSPLLPVDDLKDQLIANVKASKGRDITDDELLIASIHGRYQVFDEERPAECAAGYSIPFSCASPLGIAYSGHRYDEFIRQFTNHFPSNSGPNAEQPLEGLICNDFGPAIEGIANFFRAEGVGCVSNVYRCSGPEAACPAFPHSGEPGQCTPYPQANGDYYCNSGIQVRISARDDAGDPITRLESTGYCVEGSVDLPDFPNGCVVDPARYEWAACPGSSTGLILQWKDDQWHNVLTGLDLQIRYAQLPDTDGE